MKKYTLIVILSICCTIYSQEPPAKFKFGYKNLATDTTQLYRNFEIRTSVYRDNLEPISNGHLDYISQKTKLNGEVVTTYNYKKDFWPNHWWDNLDGDYLAVYIDNGWPNKNDIALFSLRKRSTNEYFNIYIRLCSSMDPGDTILLENLRFEEGNFFYDMCDSKLKFQKDCLTNRYVISNSENNIEIILKSLDLTDLRNHTIKLNRIKRIQRRSRCE